MKKYSLVKKGAALAVAAAVTLSAGNVALADSHSGAFTIDRGNYVEVLKNGKFRLGLSVMNCSVAPLKPGRTFILSTAASTGRIYSWSKI